jgi:Raf kinase inhibitor-like YbhB/YbcL family protein
MVVDIDPTATGLGEGASGSSMPAGARELQNTWGEAGYGGPQPPPDSGDHEYEVTVYALDVRSVDLPDDADFAQFLTEMRDHMLAAATVSGTFGR